MKLALLSDLHANYQALTACLDNAYARGADQFAFLGDLVGYGADPGPVVDVVMQMTQAGAWVIRGNHDDAATAPRKGTGRADHEGARWTHAHLAPSQRAFLAGLPLTMQQGFILLVHASAADPRSWQYIDDPASAATSMQAAADEDASHVFCGHVHEQRLFFQGAGRGVVAFDPVPGVAIPVPAHRQWLATIGSVGQPRDGHNAAMYALFDTEALLLTFVRVQYDFRAAAQAILRAGLPQFDALRLEAGR